MSKLEVWGATVSATREAAAACGVPGQRQLRAVALVPSRVAFARALQAAGLETGSSEAALARHLRDYGCPTGNAEELAAAVVPGQVLIADLNGRRAGLVPWPPE
jgi:hypothetical protein